MREVPDWRIGSRTSLFPKGMPLAEMGYSETKHASHRTPHFHRELWERNDVGDAHH